jgi:TonB family protein
VIAAAFIACAMLAPTLPAQDSQSGANAPPKRIRIGGNVEQAQLIHMVPPAYPADAKIAHIAGTVVLHAVIARDGSVQSVIPISGPPMLLQPSIDAVKQWTYKPTKLAGEPVEVDTTISIVFTLGDNRSQDADKEPQPQAPAAFAAYNGAAREARSVSFDTNAKLERVFLADMFVAFLGLQIPQPIYPEEAIRERVSGTVVMDLVVSQDGTVKEATSVSGPPMLATAAADAARKWTFDGDASQESPVEAEFHAMIVYPLGANPPADYKETRDHAPVMPLIIAVSPADAPSTYPAAARAGKAPFPDTLEGMKEQMEGALEVGRFADDTGFYNALDSFAIEDPKVWLEKNFGASAAAALVPEYETSLFHFKEHMARMRGYWNSSAGSLLRVGGEVTPKPPAGDANSEPPHLLSPLGLENYRFNIFTGRTDPGDWVFSFVYLDGAFRIIGGSYAFWDDDWSKSRMRMPMVIADLARGQLQQDRLALNKGIEGIETLCPGDGLVRVLMSPKVAAERLELRVEPVYPEEAKAKGIEGTVLFQVIIGRDGSVKELELQDGDPLLSKAAEQAVRQWRYKPMIYYETTVSRERPAEMDTAISVEFKLNQPAH